MPVIYEAKCSQCDYAFRGSEGYWAVIVDHPEESALAHPENPRLVILAHPGEDWILTRCGFTYKSASTGGRLVAVRSVTCSDCGTMYELHRAASTSIVFLGGVGCAALLMLAITVMAAAAIVGVDFWAAAEGLCIVCAAGLSIGEVVVSRGLRARYPDRVKEFDRGPGCPQCHSLKYTKFPPLRWKLLCPECGSRTVGVKAVGMS